MKINVFRSRVFLTATAKKNLKYSKLIKSNKLYVSIYLNVVIKENI